MRKIILLTEGSLDSHVEHNCSFKCKTTEMCFYHACFNYLINVNLIWPNDSMSDNAAMHLNFQHKHLSFHSYGH